MTLQLNKKFISCLFIFYISLFGNTLTIAAMIKETNSILHINQQSPFIQGLTFDCSNVKHKLVTEENFQTEQCFIFHHEPNFITKVFQTVIGKGSGITQLLQRNLKLTKTFIQKDTPLLPDEFLQNSSKYPLWLLSDCTAGDCPLNRCFFLNNTEHCGREITANKILETVKVNFKTDQTFTMVLFAPGNLLTELATLSELIKQGFKIKIVLIDKAWDIEYIESIKSIGNFVPLDIQDINPKKQNWLRFHTYKLAQFIHWLSFINKTSDYPVTIYSCVSDYLKDCRDNSSLMANIIASFDYISGGDYLGLNAQVDFIKLSLFGLKREGFCFDCCATPPCYSQESREEFENSGCHFIKIQKKVADLDWSILDNPNNEDLYQYLFSFYGKDVYEKGNGFELLFCAKEKIIYFYRGQLIAIPNKNSIIGKLSTQGLEYLIRKQQ